MDSKLRCSECSGTGHTLIQAASSCGPRLVRDTCTECGGSGEGQATCCVICGKTAVGMDADKNPACDACLSLDETALWGVVEAQHYGRRDESGARLMPGPIDVAPLGVGDLIDRELAQLAQLSATG